MKMINDVIARSMTSETGSALIVAAGADVEMIAGEVDKETTVEILIVVGADKIEETGGGTIAENLIAAVVEEAEEMIEETLNVVADEVLSAEVLGTLGHLVEITPEIAGHFALIRTLIFRGVTGEDEMIAEGQLLQSHPHKHGHAQPPAPQLLVVDVGRHQGLDLQVPADADLDHQIDASHIEVEEEEEAVLSIEDAADPLASHDLHHQEDVLLLPRRASLPHQQDPANAQGLRPHLGPQVAVHEGLLLI